MLHVALVLWPLTRMIDWEKGFQWDARYYAQCLGFTLGPLWLPGAEPLPHQRRGRVSEPP